MAGLFYTGRGLSDDDKVNNNSQLKIPDYQKAAQCLELGARWGDAACASEAAYFSLFTADEKNYQQAALWSLNSVVQNANITSIHIFDDQHLYYIMRQLVTEYPHAAAKNASWEFNLDRLDIQNKGTLFSNLIRNLLDNDNIRTLPLRNVGPTNLIEARNFLRLLHNMPQVSEVSGSFKLHESLGLSVVDVVSLNPAILKFDVPFSNGLRPQALLDALEKNQKNDFDLEQINALRAEHGLPLKKIGVAPFPTLKAVILHTRNATGDYRYIQTIPENELDNTSKQEVENRQNTSLQATESIDRTVVYLPRKFSA